MKSGCAWLGQGGAIGQRGPFMTITVCMINVWALDVCHVLLEGINANIWHIGLDCLL